MNSVKEIDIKSSVYNFLDDTINVKNLKNLDPDKIRID